MTETRLGRQTPTQSVTIPYSKTRGQEAAELYAKTGNELLEWQQLLQCDIMAVNDDGLWMHQKYGYSCASSIINTSYPSPSPPDDVLVRNCTQRQGTSCLNGSSCYNATLWP